MKLDVIDFSDPILGAYKKIQASPYSDGIITMYPMSNGIVKMIADVCTMANGSGRLNVLRIWGHGWAGGQMLAGGTDPDEAVKNGSALWGPDINSYVDDLKQFDELFSEDGRLELKGCSVAAGTDGEIFMVKLAVAINRNVYDSTLIQGGPGSTARIGNDLGWDGHQVTMASPDRTVVYGPGTSLRQ